MLAVQRFILEHEDDWENLIKDSPYHIQTKHKTGTFKDTGKPYHLVLFNYVHGLSGSSDIVTECRGLILDIENECSVVRYGFNRFYNLGEPCAAELNNNISATEKVDGSLVFMYFFDGKWRFGTRSVFDLAEDKVAAGNTKKLRRMQHEINDYLVEYEHTRFNIEMLDPDCTYCFEFVSPNFQIIIPYKRVDMYFLMCRNNRTLEEVETRCIFHRPKVYDFKSLKDIEEYVSTFKAQELEGIVVKDSKNDRVKIKNLNWLQIHYLYNNGQFSDKYFIKLYFEGDYEELLSYFPNLREKFNAVVERYNKIKQVALLLDNIPFDEKMKRYDFFKIVDKTVHDGGFQMLVMKSYEHRAYDWFTLLDWHWYANYFIKEDK